MADELSGLPRRELMPQVRRQITAMLRESAAVRIVDCDATAWRHDPWSLGSCAIARPGAAAARAVLRRPFAGRLFCAGESTAAEGWHGTVAGAYFSRRAAAHAVLAARCCRGPVTM